MKYHYQLHIASPCHEEWDNMQPNEMGRYCDSCQKTVIDFSKMTEIEIATFLHLRQGESFCGNMELSQGQKNYTFIHTQRSDSPVKRYVMVLFAGMIALPSAVFSQNEEIKQARVHDYAEMLAPLTLEKNMSMSVIDTVMEQGMYESEPTQRIEIKHSPNLISGRLINEETGLPIKYATVSVGTYHIEHLLQPEFDALGNEIDEIKETHKDSQRFVEKQEKRLAEIEVVLEPYNEMLKKVRGENYSFDSFRSKTDENGYFQFYLPAEITEGQITLFVELEDNAIKDENGKPKFGYTKEVRNLAIRFQGGTYYKEIKVKAFNTRMVRGVMVSPRPILVDE